MRNKISPKEIFEINECAPTEEEQKLLNGIAHIRELMRQRDEEMAKLEISIYHQFITKRGINSITPDQYRRWEIKRRYNASR
jgi:hypothetical protein